MTNSEDVLKLNFNLTKLEPDGKERVLQLNFSKNSTLGKLKQKLSKKIGIAPSEFTLKRQAVTAVLKDDDHTLMMCGITTNGALLEVLPGAANREGVYDLKISLVRILRADETY